MAFYLARTATYRHEYSHVHYTRRALSNHINFVSVHEILPRAVTKYTCLQKPLKWLMVGKCYNKPEWNGSQSNQEESTLIMDTGNGNPFQSQ